MTTTDKMQFYNQLFSTLAVENIANGDVIKLSSEGPKNRIDIFRRKGCPEYEHGEWNISLEADSLFLKFNTVKYEIVSWDNKVLTLKNKLELLRLKLYKS